LFIPVFALLGRVVVFLVDFVLVVRRVCRTPASRVEVLDFAGSFFLVVAEAAVGHRAGEQRCDVGVGERAVATEENRHGVALVDGRRDGLHPVVDVLDGLAGRQLDGTDVADGLHWAGVEVVGPHVGERRPDCLRTPACACALGRSAVVRFADQHRCLVDCPQRRRLDDVGESLVVRVPVGTGPRRWLREIGCLLAHVNHVRVGRRSLWRSLP